MDAINILIITSFFEPLFGGGERQLRYLCNELLNEGHRVRILTLGVPGCPQEEIVKGVHISRFGSCREFKGYEDGYNQILYYLANNEQPDIVYFLPNPHWAVQIQADILDHFKNINVPVAIRFSSVGSADKFISTGTFKFNPLLHSQVFFSLNNQIKNELIQIGVNEKRIINIVNGVNHNIFKPLSSLEKAHKRKVWGIDENKTVVLTASRFSKKKKLFRSIDVWLELECKGEINCKYHQLLIVGGSNFKFNINGLYHKNDIENYIEKRSNSITVITLTDQTNIHDLFGISDVYLTMSKNEGMSNSCLEAISTGLPIIFPNDPCYECFFYNGFKSLCYDDDNGLRHSICQSLNLRDTDKYNLSKILRKHTLSNFALDTTLNPIISTFEKIHISKGST